MDVCGSERASWILRSPNLLEGLHDGRHVGSQLVGDTLLAAGTGSSAAMLLSQRCEWARDCDGPNLSEKRASLHL